jgi:hypothetical protein
MAKKPKLQNYAEEIAKLERQVNRRYNQLNKQGVETEKPQKEKPKTVKQAKEIIFKMESYLRHTSSNASERKGAERGEKIRKEKLENKRMDRDYRNAKKLMKKAKDYFLDEIADPINSKRMQKGLPLRSFKDELNDFILGLNPKDIKDKKYQKESAKRMRELSLKYKNNPSGAHKELVNEGAVTLRLNILHSLGNITSSKEYEKFSKYFQAMSEQELYNHYKANQGLYDRIMDDSDTVLSDYEMDEYLQEIKDALDVA